MTRVAGGESIETRAGRHLAALCSVVPDRRPGSSGNDEATTYAANALAAVGWDVATPAFPCMDWSTDGGEVVAAGTVTEITPAPYGLGVVATGPLRIVSKVEGLQSSDLAGSIILLHGAVAAEPLTPKAFPFYQNDEHSRIIRLLERSGAAAVVAVTGRFPALCGALDPFPLIEDGDFSIPVASVRPDDAAPLLDRNGARVRIEIRSARWLGRARNVIASIGPRHRRITVIAHIDTKPGTPGAVDNAAGVVVLLLLAELLSPARVPGLRIGVELLAVNGEDHFAAPGELDWLAANDTDLDSVELAINIDGAGYRGARSAYSTYNLSPDISQHVRRSFAECTSLISGPQWYQSDHAIFAMRGRPALAVTTELVVQMLEHLFHSPADTPDQVEPALLTDLAAGLARLITNWPDAG